MKKWRERVTIKTISSWVIAFFALILAFPISSALATKGIVMTATSYSIQTTKKSYVKIYINTEGETIGAVEFHVAFDTEILSYETYSNSGSLFDLCIPVNDDISNPDPNAVLRFACGKYGSGFSSTTPKLMTTLTFTGRSAGTTNISFTRILASYLGDEKTGYISSPISIKVYGEDEVIPEGEIPDPGQTGTIDPNDIPTVEDSTLPSGNLPAIILPKDISPKEDSSIEGYIPSVTGSTGASEEQALMALQSLEESNQRPSIKGLFQDAKMRYAFLPSLFLIALVIYLAMKLYFTEKRRHLEIEKVFRDHMGTLGALESKIDLLDAKGEEGKKKFLDEFETAKNQMKASADAKSKTNLPDETGESGKQKFMEELGATKG